MATAPLRRGAARRRPLAVLALVAIACSLPCLLAVQRADAAVAPVPLGAAAQFSVLAGAGITNTGPTTLGGDVGTFPTTSQTGFGSVTVLGTNHGGDAVTQQAKVDLTTAYGVAAGSGPPTLVPVELGGKTLTPGVYRSPTFGITGTLTLDTQGDPDAVFIFQASSTLTTASNSSVVVLGGATACNVFWQVGSSATLGTGSHLVGSVLAETAITATTGATVYGRLLARTAAVTLDTNTIARPVCATGGPTTTLGLPAVPPLPTPTSAPPATTTTAAPTTTTAAPTTTTPTTTAAPPVVLAPTPGAVPATAGGTVSAPRTRTASGGDASTTYVGTDRGTGTGTRQVGSTPGRPSLPVTGSNPLLALLGVATLGVGVSLVAASRPRRSSAR